jgi:CheY-like chemotaxis protein
MPEMDGMEMTRRIREGKTADIEPSTEAAHALGLASWNYRVTIPRDIPIIALTAYAMAGDKERFMSMGVDYYLAKPVNAEELSALLSQVSALLDDRDGKPGHGQANTPAGTTL